MHLQVHVQVPGHQSIKYPERGSRKHKSCEGVGRSRPSAARLVHAVPALNQPCIEAAQIHADT